MEYLIKKTFDSNMDIKEIKERSFIRAIEVGGIQFAILEYLLHSEEDEIKEIKLFIKQLSSSL